jgi:hypothetical protein
MNLGDMRWDLQQLKAKASNKSPNSIPHFQPSTEQGSHQNIT